MRANSFGSRFVITTFGESHGPAMGVVIDGCPAGVVFDKELLKRELEKRRPGTSEIVSARNESDVPEILSGVFDGKTLGTPLAVIIRNQDQRSSDYEKIKYVPRVGHADEVWAKKFGHTDLRGGGRSSGRETVSRVIGGAVAQMALRHIGDETKVIAFAKRIGPLDLELSNSREDEVKKLLVEAREKGYSYGGIAEIWIDHIKTGVGEPVFRKLKSDLAQAYMSVGATIGVEFGVGFAAVNVEGSIFHNANITSSSVYGGMKGGISTGERIVARVAFKPTSSVLDVSKKGRHDPCIVFRALPVLEGMTYLVIADHLVK
ncbi:MAG: chorismate synthase [Pseudomonadota bacterium]|nr:chorismate synthase [Pseudomonadota bacterium]